MRGTIPTGRFDQRIAVARDSGWSSSARCAEDSVFLNARAAAATGAASPLPGPTLQSVVGPAAALTARRTPPISKTNTTALDVTAARRFIGFPLQGFAATLEQYPSHRASANRKACRDLAPPMGPLAWSHRGNNGGS